MSSSPRGTKVGITVLFLLASLDSLQRVVLDFSPFSLPLFLATLIVTVTLMARWLKGRTSIWLLPAGLLLTTSFLLQTILPIVEDNLRESWIGQAEAKLGAKAKSVETEFSQVIMDLFHVEKRITANPIVVSALSRSMTEDGLRTSFTSLEAVRGLIPMGTRGSFAFSLYDSGGQLIAWAGKPYFAPGELHAQFLSRPPLEARKGGARVSLISRTGFVTEGGKVSGTLVTERLLAGPAPGSDDDISPGMQSLASSDAAPILTALSRGSNDDAVQEMFEAKGDRVYRGAENIRKVYFPLRASDGEILLTAELNDPGPSETLGRSRRHWLNTAAALLFLAWLLLATMASRFEKNAGTGSWIGICLSVIAVVGARTSLALIHWDRAFQDVRMFQPSAFALEGGLGLAGSAWELLLSSVAAILIAVYVSRLITNLDRYEKTFIRLGRWALWLVAVPALFWAWSRFCEIVVENSGESILSADPLVPGSPAASVRAALLLLLTATALPLGALIPRKIAVLSESGPSSGPWKEFLFFLLAVLASVVASLSISNAGHYWPEMVAYTGAAIVIAIFGRNRSSLSHWMTRRSRPTRSLIYLVFLPLAGVFLYPSLARAYGVAIDQFCGGVLVSEIRTRNERIVQSLRESLRELDSARVLSNDLYRYDRGPSDSLAFKLWSKTDLAASGYISSLEVHDEQGEIASRFSLHLPFIGEGEREEIWREKSITVYRETVSQIEREYRVFTGILSPDNSDRRIVVRVSRDWENIPFLSAEDPYSGLLQSQARIAAFSKLFRRDIGFQVYDEQGLSLYASSGTLSGRSPRLSRDLGGGLSWSRFRAGGERLRQVAFRVRGPQIGVLVYREDSVIDTLTGMLFPALLFLLLTFPVGLVIFLLDTRRGSVPSILTGSYYRKIFLAFLGVSIIPILVLFFFMRTYLWNQFEQDVSTQAVEALDRSRVLFDSLVALRSDSKPTPQVLDNFLTWIADVVGYDLHYYRDGILYASSKRELFSSGLLTSRMDPDLFYQVHYERSPASKDDLVGGRPYLQVASLAAGPDEGTTGVLILPASLRRSRLQNELREFENLAFLLTLLLVALLALAGYLIARRVTGPVGELVSATAKVAEGRLDVMVPGTSADELGRLSRSFNVMTRRLKEQQDDLRQRKEYIEKILDNATTGVVSLDLSNRVETINRAALDLTDLSDSASVEGRSIHELFAADGPFQTLLAVFEEHSETGRRLEKEIEIPSEGATGDSRTLRIVLLPFHRTRHQPSGRILILEDMTETLRSHRLANWAEMALQVAHEVKNPLTPIRLSAEHLRTVYRERPEEVGAALEQCVQNILLQVEALRDISSDFLSYSRPPAPTLESLDLRPFLEQLVQEYQIGAKSSIRIQFQCEPDLPPIQGDPKLLRRALINSIENSLEALWEQEGEVTVSARESEPGWIEVEVRDNGPGMTPGVLNRMFEPYFSSKESGTGLGMAIARQIIEAHHGTIRASSQANEGTKILIRLPRSS